MLQVKLMKKVCYQIVQFSFVKNTESYRFIDIFQLDSEQALDYDALIVALHVKSKHSEEKVAINAILEFSEGDDVQIETLDVLSGLKFEDAIAHKYQLIESSVLQSTHLLNVITTTLEDKEWLATRYTSEVVAYFKANQDNFPPLDVKGLSKMRNLAVKFMLNGHLLEQAVDQAYDEVFDS